MSQRQESNVSIIRTVWKKSKCFKMSQREGFDRSEDEDSLEVGNAGHLARHPAQEVAVGNEDTLREAS